VDTGKWKKTQSYEEKKVNQEGKRPIGPSESPRFGPIFPRGFFGNSLPWGTDGVMAWYGYTNLFSGGFTSCWWFIEWIEGTMFQHKLS